MAHSHILASSASENWRMKAFRMAAKLLGEEGR